MLTKVKVAGLLSCMEGQTALLTQLLYGTGMRLVEAMRLRIKDVDFDRRVIKRRHHLYEDRVQRALKKAVSLMAAHP